MRVVTLSRAQERIWLECQLNPLNVAYNNPLLYALRGPLRVDCLQMALQHIVAEQPGLRSYFISQAGVPKQVIHAFNETEVLQVEDISSLSQEEQTLRMHDWISENSCYQFQLSRLPLFRFALLKLGTDNYRLLLNIHHIVVDGYSAHLLIESISTYYEQFLNGQLPKLHSYDQVYGTYCQTDQQEESLSAMTFWQEQLEDASIRIDLFRTENRPVLANTGTRDYFFISSELTQQLKCLAKQYKTTDFTLLMSAFYIVLGYYASQDDIIIGYPLDVRPHACREIFGFFVNNIPLRARLDVNQGVQALIQQLNQTRKKIKPYQKTDLKDIIRYVRTNYPSYPDELYNVSFIRANFAQSGLRLVDVSVEAHLISTNAVKDELCLLFDENKDKKAFEFAIEYHQQYDTNEFIVQFKTAYIACLQAMVDTPEKPIKHLLLYANSPQPVFGATEPAVEDFIERFFNHVKQTPHKDVLISSTEILSYQLLYDDMMDWCERLAPFMDKSRPVIVRVNRSPTLISLLLALQWMEITYIPVDINTPFNRLQLIIEDSGAGVCIHDEKLINAPDSCLFLSRASLKSKSLQIQKRIDCSFKKPSRLVSNPVVYVIYTSGSTGIPKGVKVGRFALNNFLCGMSKYFMQEKNSLFLAITTIAFDIAGLELFLPIWQGRTLYLADQSQHKDPFKIAQILNEYPITHLQATPAMWQMLNNVSWKGDSQLIALCGGEALSKSLAQDLLSKVSQLWNMYGPTEATIWCSLKRIYDENDITVGHPIVNMNMRVLNSEQAILPPFVKGELYIGGTGLAMGYLNRPELTEKQFVRINNECLYRVGDIACTNARGEVVLYGRTDNQIKLNGYRIELGEIESRIYEIESVRECAVIVVQNQLVAYISLKNGCVLLESALLSALERILPDYMIPKQCLFLDALPLTTSGKLDRKSLPVPLGDFRESCEPSNDTEKALLDLWQAVLHKRPMSVTEHFYRLGGHSLLVLQLLVQINAHFKKNLQMADILNHLTIRKQAELILAQGSQCVSSVMQTQEIKAPFTAAQRRIWFASQLIPNQSAYHMAAKLTFRGVLDIPRLANAFDLLAERHEVLRAIIEIKEGEPWQNIQKKSTLKIEQISGDTYLDWVFQPFQANELWWRVGICSIENEHNLYICIHHAIADGYSVSLFLKELFAIYQYQDLPAIQNRYLDCIYFELSKKESLENLTYWQNELLESSYLELPFDHNQDGLQSQYIEHTIDDKTWKALKQSCANRNLSLSRVLIATFGWLMYQWSKKSDFCIGVPIAQRENQACHDKVGCFMDMLPLRLSIHRQRTFSEWIDYVQQQVTKGLSHYVSFSSLLSHLKLERHDAFLPLFPVVINIQPNPFEDIFVDGQAVLIHPIHAQSHKYPLSLDIYFSNERATCHWEYAADKFKSETIDCLINQFSKLLTDLVSMPDSVMAINQATVSSRRVMPIASQRDNFRAPESLLQQAVAAVWQTILGVSNIGLGDHFFRLGGHSFLVAKMISDLTHQMNLTIPMELVFRFPVLMDFCQAIESLPKESTVQFIDDKRSLDLTPNQQQMMLALKDKPNETYHVTVLMTKSFWDVKHLNKIINEFIAMHSIYKGYLTSEMTFGETDFQPTVMVEVFNLNPDESILEWAKLQNTIPIDVTKAPLLRVCVAKGAQEGLLVILHHLIADEQSLQLFATALLDRYEGNFEPLIGSSWQQHASMWLHPNPRSIAYWQQYLSTFKPSIILPTRQASGSQALHVRAQIPAFLTSECERLAKESGSTLFHLMLCVFVYFVRHLSSDSVVAIAVTYDRRYTQALQNLQGYLVNLLPLMCDMSALKTWELLLQSIKADHLRALEESSVDYAYLLAQGLVSSPGIVFNYQHTVFGFDADSDIKWYEINHQQARFPITFHVRKESQGTILLDVEYDSSQYDTDFVKTILTTFVNLIQRLPIQYQRPFEFWSFGEYHEPVSSFQSDVVALSQYQGMDIDYRGRKKTRDLLWKDVSKIAYALQTDECLKAGDVVGLLFNDRYAYIVSLLAVLRVGGSFLPIDVNLPHDRQQFMVSDSGAKLVVDDDRYNQWVKLSVGTVDAMEIDDRLPAYIIYTSGTTGLPKGTRISRSALQMFISGLQNQLQLNASDRILHFSSPSFDASIWEIFLALMTGASLVIPDEYQRRVGEALTQFIKEQRITHAILTPSVLNTLNPDDLPSLRVVASGGESCTANLIAQWANRCAFYNAYGPTEATVCVALKRLTLQSQPNCIGRALGFAKLMVVSQALLPLPAGVIGELLIGGPILAENYINQPELSQSRFILMNGQRWYRSGDRVRQTAAGEFEYIGREDSQVKLRGLRIELHELESVISTLAHISRVCCVVQDEQLMAYVTAEEIVNESEVLALLAKKIPHYMLPARLLQIEAFPLLTSGKVNINEIPRILESKTDICKPRTLLEQDIWDIWSKRLNRVDIDIHQDFFRLGGNSLQAMSIATDLEKNFLINVSFQIFYSHGTIAKLSEYIEKEQATSKQMDDWLDKLSDIEKQALLESLNV